MKKIEFEGVLIFDITNYTNDHINDFLKNINDFFQQKDDVIGGGIKRIKYSMIMFEYSIIAEYIVADEVDGTKFADYLSEFIIIHKYKIEGIIKSENEEKVKFYKEPQFLYQYTSIDTLALILKKKTIRFNSLKYVDDGQEVKTKDYGDFGRFCLVSCWTDANEELIPLWSMYTPNMQGVRIKLPINPFKKYIYNAGEYNFKKRTVTWVDMSKNYAENMNAFDMPISNFLERVIYTDDEDKIIPSVFKRVDEKKVMIDKSKIGIYKNKAWNFQKEWRYRIFLSPWTSQEMERVIKDKDIKKHIELFERYKDYELKNSFYDLELDEDKLNQIEILLGPRVTEAQKDIVNLLVDNYIKENEVKNAIKVEPSKLRINARNV